MAVRLVCRACGKRLKLPDEFDGKRAAKCPKCGERIELGAALEASAYLPTLVVPNIPTVPAPAGNTSGAPSGGAAATQKPPPLLGENDPLPYPTPKPKPAPPSRPVPPPLPPSATSSTIKSAHPPAEEPLSLDDDDDQTGSQPEPPFRVPVWVLADSARQIVGPCFAVLVGHGLFLEHEPMKPFLYAPLGCRAESPSAGELLVTLPDRRAVTFRFRGRAQRSLARDTRAFLAGQRPVPLAVDYRRKWWMLWAALIFALGLAGGPLVLAQTANLGWEFGLQVGVAFALVGLLVNGLIALFSRWSAPGQLALMAAACVLVTGVFLFGAVAFLAGRQKGIEEARSDQQPPPSSFGPTNPNPNPKPPEPPSPAPGSAPTHLDRAYTRGVSALEDGPADVTALTIAPDGNTLGIGHADGTTRLCLFDQPTFDAIQAGPKADGPVVRVLFDSTSRFVFAITPTGAIGTSRNGPFVTLAKIPGSPVAIAPALTGDRVHFAAVRGNTIQHRSLATAFIQRPPVKAKDDMKVTYALPGKGDEVVPPGSGPDPPKPGGGPGPTFLAWVPNGRLFAGQQDGTVSIWSSALRAEAPNRDHKAAVKAWADCPGTGDFVTGDDQGHILWWPYKGGKPTAWSVLATPITALSFAPSGAWIAVADTTGWLVIWDVAAGKALHRIKRPTPIKVMAFAPDDVLVLASGKTVEVWWLPELVK
jgi:hypothetical protein